MFGLHVCSFYVLITNGTSQPAGFHCDLDGNAPGARIAARRRLPKRPVAPIFQVEANMAIHEPEIEILGPEDEKKQTRIRARFWPTVKKALRTIPFMDEVIAAYFAMLDPQTPMAARLTLIGALAYFVLPFDLVPDFLFGVGFLDDASILAAAIASVSASITDDHREAARQALAEGSEDRRGKSEAASA
jgi:uncharacterized membrane protein YkvA (DUF1232 family)